MLTELAKIKDELLSQESSNSELIQYVCSAWQQGNTQGLDLDYKIINNLCEKSLINLYRFNVFINDKDLHGQQKPKNA